MWSLFVIICDWYVAMFEFRIDIKKKYVAVRLDYVLKI